MTIAELEVPAADLAQVKMAGGQLDLPTGVTTVILPAGGTDDRCEIVLRERRDARAVEAEILHELTLEPQRDGIEQVDVERAAHVEHLIFRGGSEARRVGKECVSKCKS